MKTSSKQSKRRELHLKETTSWDKRYDDQGIGPQIDTLQYWQKFSGQSPLAFLTACLETVKQLNTYNEFWKKKKGIVTFGK